MSGARGRTGDVSVFESCSDPAPGREAVVVGKKPDWAPPTGRRRPSTAPMARTSAPLLASARRPRRDSRRCRTGPPLSTVSQTLDLPGKIPFTELECGHGWKCRSTSLGADTSHRPEGTHVRPSRRGSLSVAAA